MEENVAIRSREPCRETTWRWASPVNKVTVESRRHFLVVCIKPRTFSQLSNVRWHYVRSRQELINIPYKPRQLELHHRYLMSVSCECKVDLVLG